ncbi:MULTISPECIES: gamma-glutamyl-gamma-aminobutyrate hydrolase family protein [unclassified Lysobacter]|uniref:type 1 glutamine amidotransferase n=1 Tax=unclassified Lysobacter TaxID=2635362 RepID=UPI001BEB0CA8|nr:MULTISPECIES: gamma-glutamyl-gamma-aminobutyrate hydrolase family protein [unclassified Lysobacter]MBT2748875.1 gamma-glutamyl-gamma-aminobutyrate hydrolase family protein [Lysobacter sp. ISL-42]MBT2753097.1 gamma-glutamyl-gamma-aminobutyrate hydrolase family protein [Lysobacter sp. ISL-50]MBT2777266.1 gamma-glutamyl-gamma-aminobutyrate hydrolase family protein [Lysobacter sp. ISL-54]MBT2783246.1 gamma-glutamyl-gamma-aminobutyrate hydrolase family protein [Lysobacter sp. ISL-52]
MSRILVFQHVAAEPLGTLDPLIRRRGHRIRFTNFDRDPEAQPNVDRYRGLIVLGGPMNVEDQATRTHLKTELLAIERMLEQGKPVLGICLGAQLLAHVLGAPVRRHHQPEIGWYRLQPTAACAADLVLAPLAQAAPVFQWHRYSFEVPQGAQHLARTDTCEQQAFRWGDNAYGFQFHLEMDVPLIERWLANPVYREELAELGHDTSEAAIRAQTLEHIQAMQTRADAVFNNFLDLIGRPQRKFTLPSREWV